ncbi:hypothetical protein KI387_033009, partial [Taxus chinensis]
EVSQGVGKINRSGGPTWKSCSSVNSLERGFNTSSNLIHGGLLTEGVDSRSGHVMCNIELKVAFD